jgi:hypothetical protein
MSPIAQDVADEISATSGADLKVVDINDMRVNPGAVNLTMSALKTRLGADPWLPVETTCSNSLVRLGSGV